MNTVKRGASGGARSSQRPVPPMVPQGLKWQRPAWALLSVVLCILIVGQAFLSAVGPYDQGFALTNAWRLWRGEVPHVDYWSVYPPGSSLLLALSFEAMGANVLASRMLQAVWGLVLLAATAALARVWSPVASMLVCCTAALWFVAGMYPAYSAASGVAVLVLSLAVLQQGLNDRNSSLAWISGSLAGAVVLFRHDFAVYLGIAGTVSWLMLLTLSEADSRAARLAIRRHLAASAVAAALILATTVWLTDAFELWTQLIVTPATVMRVNRHLPLPSLLPMAGVNGSDWLLAWAGPLVISTLATSLLVLRARLPPGELTFTTLVLCLAALLTQQAFSRLDAAHVAPSAIVLCIALGALTFSKRLQAPAPKWLRYGRVLLWTSWLFATWIGCVRYLDVAGIVRCAADFRNPSCMKVDPDAVQVAATVRSVTGEGEFIFVGNLRHDRIYVNDALMYFLIQRPIAVKWNEMHPGIVTTETVQHQIIAALETRKVRIAVLADMPHSQEPNDSSKSSGINVLDIYLAQKFRTTQQVGRYRIIERIL